MNRKCLIANRGEIAVRIVRACHELGIKSVAVYSEPDTHALHVQMADEAYPLGGVTVADSYLNISQLLKIAHETGCDCVHPGYGFLSESPDFARAVIEAGLTWVGPPPEAISAMGVKTEARALMERAGVPVVPGFASESAGDDAFVAAAAEIGYPVMVKAAGGGGGKGIRIVREAADLPDALAAARREADKAFGDPRLFLEQFIEAGRHIEAQVIADQWGAVLHLFERECSVQRRHQKIIEESPSPLLDDALRERVGAAAVEAARAVGYVNAGTVEFIANSAGEFYFLEMNTRLQVEHPVTELVAGVDLVKLQFRVAGGEALPFTQGDLRQQGHAIECRIYAEDPHNSFLPATGRIEALVLPQGPGIRVDAGVQAGDLISIHYDPMIAKVIVHDQTRSQAIQRMRRALEQTVVLGLTTNLAFLLALLEHPAFVAGEVDTGYIDRHLNDILPAAPDLSPEHLIALAVAEFNTQPVALQTTGEGGNGDRYSPWNRADRFRIGQR